MFSIDRDLKHLHHIPTLSYITHAHIHTHTYTQTHTHKHIHTPAHTQTHAQCTHMHAHMHTHAYTMHTHMHTLTHMHTHTHTHTHTCTHTHTLHILPTGLWLCPPAGLCHLGRHGLQLRDEAGTRSLHGAGEVPRLPEGVPRPHLWHQGGHG